MGQIPLFFWSAGSGEGWCGKGAAPWPCQAPHHGSTGLLACGAAADVSTPTPGSSLTHPNPGKHLHPSSILGNICILETITSPAPAWRTSPSQGQFGGHVHPRTSLENISNPGPVWRTSPTQDQPGGHLHPRTSLENISIPGLVWRTSPTQEQPRGHLQPRPSLEDISNPGPGWRTSPSQEQPRGHLCPSSILVNITIPTPVPV